MARPVQLVLVKIGVKSQQLLDEHSKRDFTGLPVDGLLEHFDDIFTHLCLDVIKDILEMLYRVLNVFRYLVVLES